MKVKLEQTLNLLNQLDSKRITLVMYFPSTMELILQQHGSNTVRLNHLVGFLNPIKHTCIWYPEDLQYVKNTIRAILDSNSTILVAPIKNGYRVWEMGDIAYTSRPRFLTDIKFYSVSNRILTWLERLKSEEVKLLYRIYVNKK